jgi:hypothetical protein
MIISLERVITLPMLIRRFLVNSKKQKEFIKKTIAIDIQEIKKDNDKTLTDKDFKKITSYYGLAVPAILGEGFCLLRGKKMTYAERYKLTYMGALTGLFDDFFDEKNTDEHHIKELIDNPGELIANNSHEKLFIRLYEKVLDRNNTLLVKEYLNKVFDAQVLSKKQKDSKIKEEDIKSITVEKGGTSILFYRCVFPEQIKESELKMLYHLGGLGQLENDIFDVYKDYMQQIRTLATIETQISKLRFTYISLMHDVFNMLNQTDFPPKNKKKFLHFISLIFFRGLVCLDLLQKQETISNGVFSVFAYPRKNLVCDMSKLSNQLRLFSYYFKYRINSHDTATTLSKCNAAIS